MILLIIATEYTTHTRINVIRLSMVITGDGPALP